MPLLFVSMRARTAANPKERTSCFPPTSLPPSPGRRPRKSSGLERRCLRIYGCHMDYYDAGHMMYLRKEDLAKLKKNVASFILEAASSEEM